MQAAFVIFTAESAFHQFDDAESRRRFRTHPANCLHFSALRALEDHSVVIIAETLGDQDGLFPHHIPIRQQADLFLHRNAISHPTVVKWRPTMKPFVAAKRPLYDWIPAMVWDLQRSINDELQKAGSPTFYDTINVTEEMGRMLHSILNFALRTEFQFPPDISPVVEKMRSNVPKFIALLEKFPDGNTGKDRSSAPGIIPA